VAFTGLATSIFTAVIGLRQNDIKKVLAYSTVSQLGLMFLSLGMGAYSSALFHVTTHAFFKALLFLAAGSVIHGLGGEQDIRQMGGLRKHMPITFWVFLIGTFAISGFPLLSGFFSKDEILAHTYEHGGAIWWGLSTFSAMLTAIYMSRLLYVTFFGTFRGGHEKEHHIHESPAVMTLPLVVLAILSVVGGFLNTPHFLHLGAPQWLAHWLSGNGLNGAPVIPFLETALTASTEFQLMGVATTIALAVIGALYVVYQKTANLPVSDQEQQGFTRWIAHKFYEDELYHALFVQPVEKLSKILYHYADVQGVDGVVNGVGKGVQAIGGMFRRLQNGNIEYYLLGMVIGGAALLLTVFL
jgi:NADH-quinone oxidoreductase subunit L